MRLAPLLLMITSILISGCASHSVDCTMGAVARGPGIIRCLSNPMLPRLDQYQNDGA